MTLRVKQVKIAGIKKNGRVLEFGQNWFKVITHIKNENHEEERIVTKLEKKENVDFKPPTMENSQVNMIYLTIESLKNLYKNPDDNLPYEVINLRGYTIYRRNTNEKKSELIKKLEQSELKEILN